MDKIKNSRAEQEKYIGARRAEQSECRGLVKTVLYRGYRKRVDISVYIERVLV